MSDNIDQFVAEAQTGDRSALEHVVKAVQDRVHHLAMRMLVNPADAQDATQEILILVITKLSTFKGDSQFHTWVYRVAANYLLTAKKVSAREMGLTFSAFKEDLETGLVSDPSPHADDTVLLNELRISCTMAMLLCLDLRHRIAYVLGDVLELEHQEAAEILQISTSNYRQRLSRARKLVLDFTNSACGLANENAACSCPRRTPAALAIGRITPHKLAYSARSDVSYESAKRQAKLVADELKAFKLQSLTPQFNCPAEISARIAQIITP